MHLGASSAIANRIRKIFVDGLSVNPLSDLDPAPIELMIPVASRDLRTLNNNLESALQNILNPILQIYILTPDTQNIAGLPSDRGIRVIADHDLLGKNFMQRVNPIISRWEKRIPRGWFVQQLLKLEFARKSNSGGVLVLDSETMLLRPRSFLSSSNVQLLIPSYEFHKPYEDHYRRAFGTRVGRSLVSRLSFVSHHQVLQPSIIREMFPSQASLIEWLELGDPLSFSSPVSEYHTYGRYLVDRHPTRFVLGSFRNKAEKFDPRIDYPRLLGKQFNSISFHAYAR
jgi:hypothetical protein